MNRIYLPRVARRVIGLCMPDDVIHTLRFDVCKLPNLANRFIQAKVDTGLNSHGWCEFCVVLTWSFLTLLLPRSALTTVLVLLQVTRSPEQAAESRSAEAT